MLFSYLILKNPIQVIFINLKNSIYQISLVVIPLITSIAFYKKAYLPYKLVKWAINILCSYGLIRRALIIPILFILIVCFLSDF